ncbi:unnamed protein product [Camellia sinensis]
MKVKMEQNETGCQVPPDVPMLCVNNCGFFGSAATMNLCSKCHKDLMLKQQQTKLAASPIGSIANGGSGSPGKEPDSAITTVHVDAGSSDSMIVSMQASHESLLNENNVIVKEVQPNRCSACRKRVGLTGFNCRCGNLFCAVHRYSDKHDCPFDYRSAAQDAIAKANPVVKAEKLDKL